MAKIASAKNNANSRKEARRLTSVEEQEVQKLAYQFFVDRGYEHGYDREDWLRAEAIVRSRRS